MELTCSAGACSLWPHIALREAGLPFTAVLADTKAQGLQDGTDDDTITPKGCVPLLELDSGVRLAEGAVILQYRADRAACMDRLAARLGAREAMQAEGQIQ